MRPGAEVTLIGHAHVQEHWALRDFLTRIAQPYNWLEAGTCSLDFPEDKLPAVLVPRAAGGEIIPSASVKKIAEAWGIRRQPEADRYDLAIMGGGPAGLAAAVYAASDGLNTIVIENDLPGGQAGHTSKIENFFGFPQGIGGAELTQLALTQAAEFGAEVCSLAPALHVRQLEEGFAINCKGDGWEVQADQVIAATGMQWRRLKPVDDYLEEGGSGVHYGAGRSEAIHSEGQVVAVVGAGNSAGQAAMTFAEAGAKVKLLVRGGSIEKSMSEYLVARVSASANIEVVLQAEIARVNHYEGGSPNAPGAIMLDMKGTEKGGQAFEEWVDKVFVCIGGEPRTEWADGLDLVAEKGFLKTGPDLPEVPQAFWDIGRPPTALETSVPGLFAAGDVRWGSPRRVGGAVGDGAAAVSLAHRVRQS